MYERMLNKAVIPSYAEMALYCKENEKLFSKLNLWLSENCKTVTSNDFPYGNNYGWGIGHRIGKKLICYVFPENGAFTVMLRMSDDDFKSVYGKVTPYTQDFIDNKYPCGNGGWIHYRVLCEEHLNDIIILLEAKNHIVR